MPQTNRTDGRSGRPTAPWLQKMGAAFVERIAEHGMTVTQHFAETVVADRVKAVAAALHITERSARAYIDLDAIAAMADSVAESVADEEPGADLLTLPRTADLPISLAGRIIAGLAECQQFFDTYEATDPELSRDRRNEIAGYISLLGQCQSEYQDDDHIWAPHALFARVSRILDAVSEMTSNQMLSAALHRDATVAKTASERPH